MEKSNRDFLAVGLIVIAFLGGLILNFEVVNHTHRSPRLRANVYIIYETMSGTQTYSGGNTITDIGEDYVRDILGFNNVTGHNQTRWVTFGNSTCVQTETVLDSEIVTADSLNLERKQGTYYKWENGTDPAYNVTTGKLTVSGTCNINATGLHWNDVEESDNNMFAVIALPDGAQTFNSNDNITLTWVITWDGN
jgi:hypothetical protein